MNIKEAKQEIIYTIGAYLAQDENGTYEIPGERQRPVLLMGPPGVGKTAIMRQIAEEMGIGLVSYTITHHTRQSAIGLPYIAKRSYGGTEYSVTEYTMSEIIASVYEQIERSGVSEGILFLDEINCVSETLAPTMLQFLQYKTFGTHRLPDGYVLVTAGNPVEYNRSVRDFDIVTLDRVKKLDVDHDFAVFKEYAYRNAIHGSIPAYLEIRKEHFYEVKSEADGKKFVTARSWEDLSDSLKVYEKLGQPVTENLIGAFLQDPEIARSFAVYYELWNKYRNIYRIPDVLAGRMPEDTEMLKSAGFDEKLSLIGLLVASLTQEFIACDEEKKVQTELYGILRQIRGEIAADSEGRSVLALVRDHCDALSDELDRKKNAQMLSREEERTGRTAVRILHDLSGLLAREAGGEAAGDYRLVKGWFADRETARKENVFLTGMHLENAFTFLNSVYGESQEIVMFLTELTRGHFAMRFVEQYGSDSFYKYNKLLLLRDRKKVLQDEIMQLVD